MVPGRTSSKHGHLVDDAMAHDVEGYVRAGHDTHAEEWKSAEPPAGDATDTPAGRAGRRGTPSGMSVDDVEERSELAGWLGRAVFPADRQALVARLRDEHAPDGVISQVMAAPADVEFATVGELWRALRGGGHVEDRRT